MSRNQLRVKLKGLHALRWNHLCKVKIHAQVRKRKSCKKMDQETETKKYTAPVKIVQLQNSLNMNHDIFLQKEDASS